MKRQSMATSLNLPDTSDGSDGDGARRRKSLLAIQNRASLCTDPNCDTKLLRMRQELQLTKLKLKQMEHLSRKQQLQLQGRMNLSNDFMQLDSAAVEGSGRNLSEFSQRNVAPFSEGKFSSKCRGESKGKERQETAVKDDSVFQCRIRKEKVSSVSPRPKSSLAFVQIETVI